MCSKIKNNKVIFLDVDGTLVEPMERPSALTIEAIKKARENGHKVFIQAETYLLYQKRL